MNPSPLQSDSKSLHLFDTQGNESKNASVGKYARKQKYMA